LDSQRVIFALDQDWSEGRLWIDRLAGELWGFKVGSILFTEQGPECVRYLKARGQRVFLDLKYHDIPNTVRGAVRAAFDLGVDLVSVHAGGGRRMLDSIAPLQTQHQKILAISVLTSFDAEDIKDLGWSRALVDQVMAMAKLAAAAGIQGMVCSPLEVAALRRELPHHLLVTPGVRFSSVSQDQKRTASAQQALQAGSSLIVLGRALSESADWNLTWQEIKSSLADKF
jgi:orotidine-5'-phosphate decarboxylase